MDDRGFVRKFSSGAFALVFILSSISAPPARGAQPCEPETFLHPILSERAEFTDAVKYAETKNRLMKSRLWWSKALGRKVSQGEYNHMKLTKFIRQSIKNERPYIIVDYIRPNAHETLLSYFLLRQFKKDLDEVLVALRESPENPDLVARAKKLRQEILSQGERFGNGYDTYKTAVSYLDTIAESGSGSADEARKILAEIDSRRLLASFFERSGIRAQKSPTIAKLAETLQEFPEFELRRLRNLRNQEVVATALAISPSQLIYDAIKKTAKKVPGLNEEKLQAFFMSLEGSRMKIIYGPDIERIAISSGGADDKLALLESLNAETGDELLVTFARRADNRQAWFQMREAAEARTVKTFFQRMKKAETQAKKLGDLSDEGRSSGFVIMKRVLDFALATGVGYYAYRKIKGPSDPDETATDPAAPLPVDPAAPNAEPDEDATPTEDENSEIDQTIDQAQLVLKEIDPRQLSR